MSFQDVIDSGKFTAKSLAKTHPKKITGDTSAKTCLGCHDFDKLSAETKGYTGDGAKDVFNPHAAHVVFDCIDCHSVASDPVLQCNTCHSLDLASDWTAPTNDKQLFVDPGKIYGDLGYGTSGPSFSMDK